MTSIELSFFGDHHSVDPDEAIKTLPKPSEQQDANSTETQTTSVPIKIFLFCIKSPNRAYCGTVLFIIVSMAIGILTVYFTTPKPKDICEFTYRRTIENTRNYNSRPQSVAIGYFNNDIQLDFVIASTGTDNIEIFLGYDNGTFGYLTTYPTGYGSRPYSVAVGNFDNDNGVDIAVANFGTNSIGIFFGFNNGNFTTQKSFSTDSSHPLFIAVSDFNNDNRLDIAVVNYGTNSVGIFIGFGDGSFVLSITYSTGYDSLPNSLAIGDLNKDNLLDIVIANYGTSNIGIFFGHGNGTFENQKIYYTGFESNPSSVIISDINNDDQLDIIVANYGISNIGIFFGYGNGNFTRQITYSIGSSSHPEFIAIGNFNKDNQLDIIVTDSNNEAVYVLPGYENGTFPLLTIYYTDFGSSPFSIAVGDFNKDNSSDGLVVNRGTNNVLALVEYQVKLSVRYTTYSTGTFPPPFSLAIGDLNGDTFLDIVVTNEHDNQVGVYLGYGNGHFSSVTTFSTGSYSNPYSIVLGDFNNDHQLDIAVVNPDSNNLGILIGYGNGQFSTATTYSTGIDSSPRGLSIGDVNNDNCLDIVVVGDGSDIMEVFLGFCNGTFVIVSTYNTEPGSGPYSIVLDDFNSDNILDAAIATFHIGNVVIFLGQGDGTFAAMTTYSTGLFSQCYSIASGDFNNDNRLDIAVTITILNEIGILFGDGSGTFADLKIYPLESGLSPVTLVVDDFNNDNNLDIAVSNYYSNNVVVLFGNNNGDFSTQTAYSTGDNSYPYSVAFGDFNNDNQLDIAVTNSGSGSIGIFISYYYADFAIQAKYSTGSGPHPYSVAIGDFNNDNVLDIVVANSGYENVGIRLGVGNGTFGIETIYSTGRNSFPEYVNVGDFNRDNQLDIVIADSQGDSISIFFGCNNGTFGKPITYPMDLQSNPTSIAIADLNNDKWLDLVVTNEGTNNLGILYGYNYATFELQQTYFTGYKSFPSSVSVGDFNNDNRLDIIVPNANSSNVGIFFGYGNGTFTTQINYSTGGESYPWSIALADFNNDSYLDIVVTITNLHYVGILLGYGNGTFGDIMIYPTGIDSGSLVVVVGDVNNDNRLDVITADDDTSSIHVFLGFGDGTFSARSTYSTGLNSNPSSIALGDLNNDNYLDIVVANYGTSSVGILHGYGNGSFVLVITYSIGENSDTYSVALGDFNNDNQLDIAVTNFFFDNIGVFLGFGNGSFSTQKTYSTGSASNPLYITVGYFNEDNQADIGVICSGNSAFTVLFGIGDGTFLMGRKYPTSSSSVLKAIAYGDFNNDTRLDIVVSNILNDNIDIYLGSGNEPLATPITVTTGLDSKPHSVVVGDFNNDNRSDIAVANYGTDNVGVVLTYEIAHFSNLMTYSSGNGSHPYAVVVSDFNGDNQLDIVVANYGTNDVTVFQGYGNGMFALIGSYSTGTDSLPYAIAVSDFNNDKRMDIAVANSGANNIFILYGFGNGTFGNETSYSMGYNSRPYSLAVGDFNDDSWMDIAVANYGTDYVEILLKTC